jgi:hypothetical protein
VPSRTAAVVAGSGAVPSVGEAVMGPS